MKYYHGAAPFSLTTRSPFDVGGCQVPRGVHSVKRERQNAQLSSPSQPIEISDDEIEATEISQIGSSLLPSGRKETRNDVPTDTDPGVSHVSQENPSAASGTSYNPYVNEEDKRQLEALDEFSREAELARRYERWVRGRQREELFRAPHGSSCGDPSRQRGLFSDDEDEAGMAPKKHNFATSSMSPAAEGASEVSSPRPREEQVGGGEKRQRRKEGGDEEEREFRIPASLRRRRSPRMPPGQPYSPSQSSELDSRSPANADDEETISLTPGEQLLRTPHPDNRYAKESAILRRMRNEEAELVGRLARIAEMREREEQREKEREEEERQRKEKKGKRHEERKRKRERGG